MGILPNVADDLNVNISQAGQLITGYALGVAFGAPILAMLTHKLPQKRLLLVLMLIFILRQWLSCTCTLLLDRSRSATYYCFGSRDLLRCWLRHRGEFGSTRKTGECCFRDDGRVDHRQYSWCTARYVYWSTSGWRASFGSVVIMGIISFIGILIFIPQIKQKTNSSLARQVRSLLQPRLLLVFLIGALGCSSLFAVFTYIAPILINVTGLKRAALRGSSSCSVLA